MNIEFSDFTEADLEMWNQLHSSESTFYRNRMTFFSGCSNKVPVLRQAMQKPSHRGTALRIIPLLPVKERMELFEELVELASFGHSDISLCRDIIVNLPKEFLLSYIENTAEKLLAIGTDEEYRRLLELYILIDENLTRKLALRALENDVEDIREAGEDFIESLNINYYSQESQSIS